MRVKKMGCVPIFFWCFLLAALCLAEELPVRETRTEFASGTHDGTALGSEGVTLSTNLVKNPGFEDGFSSWSQGAAVLDSGYSGNYSIKSTATGSAPSAPMTADFIMIENSSSVKYTISAYMKANITVGNAYLQIYFYKTDGSGCSPDHSDPAYFTSSSDWTKVSNTVGGSGAGGGITFPSDCAKVKFRVGWWNASGNPSGDVWLDDLSFVRGTFSGSGSFKSRIIDFGESNTVGKIYWTADTSEGCSVSFNVASTSSITALNTPTWSDTIYTSETEINTGPGRYLQYRANLYTGNSSISPVLKEVKITPVLKGLYPSPSYAIAAGDNVSFDIPFEVPMSTADADKCTVTISPESGSSFAIPASGGSFSSSTLFRTGTASVPSNAGNGFATVRVTGGRTVTGNKQLYYVKSSILIIDNEGYVSKTKTEFFPDPFSPNGDGKCDSTKLLFSLNSEQQVTLRIYTYRGMLVRSLAENQTYYGSAQISWDGKDDAGKVLPIGIYLYQLKMGNTFKTGTVTLVK